MKQSLLLDEDIYPPFEGFPKEGLDFLKKLKKNNNREWFAKHKTEYENNLKYPLQSFIAAMKSPVAKFAPEIECNPKKSVFRIYRDIRFSKNKDPYKTHVAAIFHPKGHWETSAGYYVHIEPGMIYAGGGFYSPTPVQLKAIRNAVADRSDEFLSIINAKSFKKMFKEIQGEKLQRAPLGFEPDHPMIDYLKHKQFYTGVEMPDKECHTEKFVDTIVKVYKEIHPLITFLNGAVGKG